MGLILLFVGAGYFFTDIFTRLGVNPGVAPLGAAAALLATGWLIRAPNCGCHPQPPALIVLVHRGRRVSFLSAAGDAASPARVQALARGLP